MKEKEPGFRRFRSKIVRSALPRLIDPPLLSYPYDCRLVGKASNHCTRARQLLETNHGYICIIQITHLGLPDPILAGVFHEKYIDLRHEREVYGFVSEWHSQNNPYFKRILFPAARLAGYNLIQVVQTRMRTEEGMEKYGYTDAQIRRSDLATLRRLREIREKANKGHLITFQSAPEGTRSRTGVMGEGDRSAENVIQILSPSVVIPVAFIYKPNSAYNTPNFGHVEVGVAEPLISDEENSITFRQLMKQLSLAIPDEHSEIRGPWQDIT